MASRRTRRIRRAGIAGAVLLTGTAVAGTIVYTSGATLQQYMQYQSSVTPPPLDSMVTWGRTDVPGATQGSTSELLSLISDGSQTNSFMWPLYIELRGTTSGDATMPTSQSVGATVRSVVRSAGSPWTAGYHSELAHGRTDWASGPLVATQGTSILFNGEMRSFSTGGNTIGLNLQCVYTDSTSQHCDNGINIQTGAATTYWQNGIHFDSNGNYISGNIGINFDQSHYNMGIDLADNSLRMNAGQKIIMEKNGTVYVWFNQVTGMVEVVKNGVVTASF